MLKLIFISFLLFFSCNPKSEKANSLPKNFEGKVVAIKDGDTFKVLYEGKERTIRLEHIDCPEKSQPFGKNAKQLASDLCFGKIVNVLSNGKKDRYQRLIAEIYVGDKNVNKELVKNGLAWHFVKYSKDKAYAKLEIRARENHVGLWADIHAIAPWDWRKVKKKKNKKSF